MHWKRGNTGRVHKRGIGYLVRNGRGGNWRRPMDGGGAEITLCKKSEDSGEDVGATTVRSCFNCGKVV